MHGGWEGSARVLHWPWSSQQWLCCRAGCSQCWSPVSPPTGWRPETSSAAAPPDQGHSCRGPGESGVRTYTCQVKSRHMYLNSTWSCSKVIKQIKRLKTYKTYGTYKSSKSERIKYQITQSLNKNKTKRGMFIYILYMHSHIDRATHNNTTCKPTDRQTHYHAHSNQPTNQ